MMVMVVIAMIESLFSTTPTNYAHPQDRRRRWSRNQWRRCGMWDGTVGWDVVVLKSAKEEEIRRSSASQFHFPPKLTRKRNHIQESTRISSEGISIVISANIFHICRNQYYLLPAKIRNMIYV